MFDPSLVWQEYNPYPNLDMNTNSLWLFIDEGAPGAQGALSPDHPITDGMRQVLALYAGAVTAKANSELTHTPLLTTGQLAGLIDGQAAQRVLGGQANLMREQGKPTGPSSIAMAIEGKQAEPSKEKEKSTEGDSEETSKPESPSPIKAVYVTDTDMMLPVFLQLRADPNQAQDMRFQFQNVTFLLNTIDYLTGEIDYLEIRKHEPVFSSLQMIAEVKEEASRQVREKGKEFQDEYDNLIREAQEKIDTDLKSLREEMAEMQKKSADGTVSRAEATEKVQQFRIKQESLQRALAVRSAKAERDREKSIKKIQSAADLTVTDLQNRVKAAAVILPCIPPLIVGIIVFASRRLRERENITKSRLK
jgi:ABC-2 type transport system permease protein